VGIAHRQRYLAASVSIYWGLGGSLEQHSMQISDMNLAFVESDSILDPMTPHSSMSAIRKSNSLSFHPVCHEAAPWKLALPPVAAHYFYKTVLLGYLPKHM
jgi:hypothetical protein